MGGSKRTKRHGSKRSKKSNIRAKKQQNPGKAKTQRKSVASKKGKVAASKSKKIATPQTQQSPAAQSANVPVSKPALNRRHRHGTVFGEIYDPATDNDPPPKTHKKTAAEMEDLMKKVLESSSFLKAMDTERLTAALKCMELKAYKAGKKLFRQGELGNTFYVVKSGTFKAYKKDEKDEKIGGGRRNKKQQQAKKKEKKENDAGSKSSETEDVDIGAAVKTFDEGNPCIGEVALLYVDARPYTVKCESDGELWQIDRRPYTRVVVKMAYDRRRRYMAYMNGTPLLDQVQSYEKVRLCDAVKIGEYKEGDLIIKKGDDAEAIWWVDKGEVKVTRKDGSTTILDEGKPFAEMALLLKKPYDVTCTAESDCRVLYLETEDFERLMGHLHNIMLRDKASYKQVLQKALGTDDINHYSIR